MSSPILRNAVVAVLLSAITGCGLSFGNSGNGAGPSGGGGDPSALSCTSTSDNYGYPVQTYDTAPGFVDAWWYYGQEPPEVASDPTPGDSTPPNDDGQVMADPTPDGGQSDQPGGDDDDGDDDDDDDSTQPAPPPDDPDASLGTDSLHAKDYGAACFTCDLTCTTTAPSANQPAALRTAHGMSATSHAAACRDAEHQLKDYASSSYGLSLNSCGYSSGS